MADESEVWIWYEMEVEIEHRQLVEGERNTAEGGGNVDKL